MSEFEHKKQQLKVRLRSARKVWHDKVNNIFLLELASEFLQDKLATDTFLNHLILMGYGVKEINDFIDSMFYLADKGK